MRPAFCPTTPPASCSTTPSPWLPDDEDDPDRLTLAVLRRHGQHDLADLYASDRLEYDRRCERGRQFFFGPPDEEWATHLREKGVID